MLFRSTGFVRFGDKATLDFDICWAANAEEDCYLDVMGTKGGARAFTKDPLVIYAEHNGRLANLAPQYDATIKPFHKQAELFVRACRGEVPPAATGEQGLAVMKLIDSIYASNDAGKEVEIA